MAKIGIDLGGTAIKAARVEEDKILSQLTVETPAGGANAVIHAIAAVVKQLDPNPSAVGLAIPGEVNQDGICYRLPNIPGFENVNVAGILRPLLGCPVTVDNDGNAAAHGEALYGVGRRHKSFAMFTLGTGIGGGLVLDGKMRTGAYGFAAEIGHIPVDTRDDAWPCSCGQTGCIESYAGTRGLLRKFEELGGNAKEIVEIADSARSGAVAGTLTFEMMSTALARGITIIQNLLDLDAVVFTGGVSQSFDLIEPKLRRELKRFAFSEPTGNVPVIVSELGARAGVIGSAHLDLLTS